MKKSPMARGTILLGRRYTEEQEPTTMTFARHSITIILGFKELIVSTLSHLRLADFRGWPNAAVTSPSQTGAVHKGGIRLLV